MIARPFKLATAQASDAGRAPCSTHRTLAVDDLSARLRLDRWVQHSSGALCSTDSLLRDPVDPRRA